MRSKFLNLLTRVIQYLHFTISSIGELYRLFWMESYFLGGALCPAAIENNKWIHYYSSFWLCRNWESLYTFPSKVEVRSWAKRIPNIFGCTAKLRMIITYDNTFSSWSNAMPVRKVKYMATTDTLIVRQCEWVWQLIICMLFSMAGGTECSAIS